MSLLAFEVTRNDVEAALLSENLDDSMIDNLFEFEINTDAVQRSALRGLTMDEQVNFAHEDIRDQYQAM